MDPTERARRIAQEAIASLPVSELTETGEKTWTTDELTAEFQVIGFMAPYVVVKRRSDGVKGSLMFKHSPRIYFGFQPDR